MANSETTLASLWMEDAPSPVKIVKGTPTKSTNGSELKDDIARFYRDSGLDSMAKEVGILDNNGEVPGFKDASSSNKGVQYVAVPINSPSSMSPLMPKTHMVSNSPQVISVMASPGTPIASAESPWNRKRQAAQKIVIEPDKRGKKGEKGGKGLRHFSMKVCEKVQKKVVTSYNEVADELVQEFSDPRNMPSSSDQAYDQKNIRRRVYDALNVLMAMNIISKEKKEIKWIGLPTNSAQECQNLEMDKQKRMDRIKHKTQQLQELILQQIAFKNLVQRNRDNQRVQGPPMPNSAIQLPFIIVNTSKKTVIDCSISNDKSEYLFNFDNTFEIHDDIEVLKRMGMAMGLEKGQVSKPDLQKAVDMVPRSLQQYVIDLAQGSMANAVPSAIRPMSSPNVSRYKSGSSSMADMSHASNDAMDIEVALATSQVMSRDSSMTSHSDLLSRAATDTPSEDFSDMDSDHSSPVNIS